jgi:REP element-mobilizing transposase RayT
LDSLLGITSPVDDELLVSSQTRSSTSQSSRVDVIHPAPKWMEDVNRAAQHLTRLSLESAAHAALITRGDKLWAYAGQLPQVAARELASLVSNNWTHDGGSDLALFVRLETTASDYMFYATGLGGEYVLALAFETVTPFSEIRAQASKLATGLIKLPVESEKQNFPFTRNNGGSHSDPNLGTDYDQFHLPEDAIPLPDEDSSWDDSEPLRLPKEWTTEIEKTDEDKILADTSMDALDRSNIDLINKILNNSSSMPEDTLTPSVSAPNDLLKELKQTDLRNDLSGDHIDENVIPADFPSLASKSSDLSSSEIKRKASIERFWKSENLGINNITYACLFVPRMPSHKLMGDIAGELKSWVFKLCIAYNYRLKYIEINQDFLLWIVNIDASKSPGKMLQNIASQTSKRIFEEFPKFSRDNPSGEFWADEMFLINREQSFTQKELDDKISKIRNRQGINPEDWR